MARILNVEHAEFTNSVIQTYQKNKVGQYSKYLEKNPIFVTYYHISQVHSRTDVGTGGVEREIGERSPVRYFKITDFPIYNIPELKPDYNWDETGADMELDLSGLVVLPNTIRPLPGDHLIIKLPNTTEFMFRVNQPRYSSIQSNDFYEFDADLKFVGENIEKEQKMGSQIIAEYKTYFDLIGTEDHCFIKSTDIEQLNAIGTAFNTLTEMYMNAYYDKECNVFVFPTGFDNEQRQAVLYDPYLNKFINESEIYHKDADERTLITQPCDILQDRFKYLYSRTLYQAILNRDLTLLAPTVYSIITPVSMKYSPFELHNEYADTVQLFLGKNLPGSCKVDSNRMVPIWFSIKKLPCCGPVWVLGEQNQYFSSNFINSLRNCKIDTENILEYMIFNFIHHINDSLSMSELIQSIDIDDVKTFYYLPMVCYILGVYYKEYFKSEDMLAEELTA